MLRLANVRRNDVLYELGSGWGQNLIIASTEFGVKKCVGFESITQRYETALQRIKKRALSKKILLLKRDFQDLLKGKIPKANISEASVVLYTLSTDAELADDLSTHLSDDCRLVYSNLTLFPEFKPSEIDYPFYLSKFPFQPPSSEIDWLMSVLGKGGTQTPRRADELWSELYHDYNVEHQEKRDILDYRRRLKTVLRG
jgi:hypothetical protein